MRGTVYGALRSNNLADLRGVVLDDKLTGRERYAEYARQLNGRPHDFMCDGYIVHETFDPSGEDFADCVIRIFV